MNNKEKKVLIIGLDGATMEVIKPMSERGQLPYLTGLMNDGVSGELCSTIHPTTPQAWTSFMTGQNAGKHGVYDFISRERNSYGIRFVNGSYKKSKSLWKILSERGLKVGVMNVPFTYPPEKVNGVMISGLDSPGVESNFTYPSGLYQEIVQKIGRYDLRGTFAVGKKGTDYSLEDLDRVIENRTQVAKYLMETYPWDCFMTVFNSTDHVQHMFWQYMQDKKDGIQSKQAKQYGDIIEYTYKKVDRAIGELIEGIEEDTSVIIMSDHGGGSIKRVVNLNNWLAKNGFLYYKNNAESKFLPAILDSARYHFKRWIPSYYRDLLKTKLEIRDKAESILYFSQIDWTKTVAYSWGMYGNISLNLKGREPGGIVESCKYNDTCDQIISKLMEFEDDNESIVERVYKRDELFSGPFTDDAPDLLVCWKDYACYTQGNLKRLDGSVFQSELKVDSSDFCHTGTHRRNGIFIVKGPNIRGSETITDANIVDVMPTVLSIIDEPIPDNLDGRVLGSIFQNYHQEESSAENIEPEKDAVEQTEYLASEEKEIYEKLSSMGYI